MKTEPTLKAPEGLLIEWTQVLGAKAEAAAEYVNKAQINGLIEPKVNFIFTHAILTRIEGVLQESMAVSDFNALKVKTTEPITVPSLKEVLADKSFKLNFAKVNEEAIAQINEAKAAKVDAKLITSWETKLVAKAEVEALKVVENAKLAAKRHLENDAKDYVEDAVYRHRLIATLIASGAHALAEKPETKKFWAAILAAKEGFVTQAKNSSGAYVEGVKNGTIIPAKRA